MPLPASGSIERFINEFRFLTFDYYSRCDAKGGLRSHFEDLDLFRMTLLLTIGSGNGKSYAIYALGQEGCSHAW